MAFPSTSLISRIALLIVALATFSQAEPPAGSGEMVDASHVRLLPGSPFYDRQELHRTGYVGHLEPDRLLFEYRKLAGLPQPAGITTGYGGWDSGFIKAPPPALTSSTMARLPPAIFLLMMLATMSGSDSTVPVASRRAYILRSAGTRCSVWAQMQAPTRRTWAKISWFVSSVRRFQMRLEQTKALERTLTIGFGQGGQVRQRH